MKSTLSPEVPLARPAGGVARGALATLAALRLGGAGAMAGWPVLLGRAAFYGLLMIVLTALWDKVIAERLPGGLVASLPAGGLAIYIGVTEWIGLAVPAVHFLYDYAWFVGFFTAGIIYAVLMYLSVPAVSDASKVVRTEKAL